MAREKAGARSEEDESMELLSDAIPRGDRRIDMYVADDSDTISLMSLSRSSAPFFTESSESAASWHYCQSTGMLPIHTTHLAESIEDFVEK